MGLPEAGEWTVPLLTVYRLDGGEDNRVQMLYTGQWDLQKGCITTGELMKRSIGRLDARSLPEEVAAQFIDQYDGSFACTKDGETLRETPPEAAATCSGWLWMGTRWWPSTISLWRIRAAW